MIARAALLSACLQWPRNFLLYLTNAVRIELNSTMARLIVETGAEAGMIYPLNNEDAVTIGRSASCTVQIIDKRVSRHHAVLRHHRLGFVLEDLGSKNGTLINDKPLVGRIQLKNGDRIKIGDTSLVFESDPDEPEARAADTTRSGAVKLVGETPAPSTQAEVPVAGSNEFGGSAPIRRELLRDPFERLKVLYQVADTIRAILDLDELLHKLMDIIWNVIAPDRGIILLRDEVDQTLEPVVVRVREDATDEISISRGIVERCMAEQVAILVSDAPSDVRFAANESVIAGRIRSAMSVPLVAKNEVLGVIYVDSQVPSTTYYTNDDLELLTGIANQAALAIANARLYRQALERQKLEKELELARSIQVNLLPKSYPKIPGVTFAAMSAPAHKVGGDYYDFFELSDGRTAIVLADVSGKGMPAAILTATIRASVRMETHVRYDLPANVLMGAINSWACKDATNNMFVTMVYAVFDPKSRTLEYTNAGHMPPLLFKPSGEYRKLETGGCFLGIMEFVDYEAETLPIQKGDTLVLVTDGVTDTHNAANQVFGIERLIEVVRNNLHLSAEELRDEIYEATVLFRATTEQFDDITIVVVKF